MKDLYFSKSTKLTDPPTCPVCHVVLDAVAACSSDPDRAGEKLPTTGDITFCMYCATVLIYASVGQLRLPTNDELQGFPPQVTELMAHFAAARASRAFYGKSKPS